MNGFLLAAGRGTRLGALTEKTAKPALPVAGLPMLAYSLSLFFDAGVRKLAVNTHHCADTINQVLRRIPQPWQLQIAHEAELLDTGGGIKNCEEFLNDAPVLLANADVVCDVDVSQLLAMHRRQKAALTLVVVPHGDADRIAPVAINHDGIITDINRTLSGDSHGRHLYAGIAVFEPALFAYLRPEPSSVVYTGYTGLLRAGQKVCAYEHRGFWYDCGTPDSYAEVNRAVAANAGHWIHHLNRAITESLGPVRQ